MKRTTAAKRLVVIMAAAALLLAVAVQAPPVLAEQHIEPIYTYREDNFSQRGYWPARIDDDFRIEYTREGFRIFNNFFQSQVSSVRGFPSDIYIEVEAVRTGGPGGSYYGAVCRWQDLQNYYALVAFGDNRSGIARIVDGEAEFLEMGELTEDQFDRRGVNRIGGFCDGSTLTLLVNGETILQVEDTTFSEGAAGMVAGTIGTPGVDVTFRSIFVGSAETRQAAEQPVGIPITGPQERLYRVQRGDTLSEIAFAHRTTLADLIERNPQIDNPRIIYPGQLIAVPDPDAPTPTPTPAAPAPTPTPTQPGAADRPPVFFVPEPRENERLYTVRPGDTLAEISVEFNATIDYLLERNPHIIHPNIIIPGQRFVVPDSS